MLGRCSGAALALCAFGCGTPPLEPRDPDPGVAHFTVQTFNVEFQHASDPATVEAVGAADADVVCLQEVTPDWESAILKRYGDRYPNMLFRANGGTGGLAALSRFALQDLGVLASPDGSHPAWHVLVDSPMGPVELLNVHLRSLLSGPSSPVKAYLSVGSAHQVEIERYFASVKLDTPTLALGDFNEEPDGDAVQFLEHHGFRDVLPLYHPGQATWRYPHSWQLEQTLDHILFDDSFEPLDAWVVDQGNSDHIPVVAHFEAARR